MKTETLLACSGMLAVLVTTLFGKPSTPEIQYRIDPATNRRWPVSLEWRRPLSGAVEEPNRTGNPDAGLLLPVTGLSRRLRETPEAISGPCSPGDVFVIGDDPLDELIVFDRDTTIVGNICILNSGELRIVGGGHLTLVGDITIQGGGSLTIEGAGMTVLQEWTFQFRCLLLDSARFEIRDSEVGFNGQNWSLTTAGSFSSRIENGTFPAGHASTLLVQDASMEITDCRRPGEFIPMDSTRIAISGCDSVILWFNFTEPSGGEFMIPAHDSLISHWEFPDGSVYGIDYRITVDSTSHIIPGILGGEGIDLTVRDSDVAAFGLVFWEGTDDTVAIVGLVNDTEYADFTVDLSDRILRLVDTRIGAWNVYPFDDTLLRLEKTIFGEILASDSSRSEIHTSICDGSGGFVSSDLESELIFIFSTILTQTISRGRSLVLLAESSLPVHRVSAEGASSMILLNTQPAFRPTVVDTAVVVEAFIGLPSITPVDALIDVTGTALITPGPFSLLEMDHYLLEYARGLDPVGAEWVPIDSVGGGAFMDTLGIWNTDGLETGDYLIRLTVVSAPVDTFRLRLPTIKNVRLTESVGVGPGEGGPPTPVTTALHPNAPNPFNPLTDLRFSLRESGPVRIRIHDVRGRVVRTLLDGHVSGGDHTIHWDGTDERGKRLSSGVYLCRMEAEGERFMRKMVLAK
jgi:hypothetical protein